MKGELALQKQRNVKLAYGSFPQQHHLNGNTELFFSLALSNKILQMATVLLSTAAQRHKLWLASAVSREFIFGRGNHICQKHHTFNTVSFTCLLNSLCSDAANRLPHGFLASVCWRTKPDAE